MAKYKYSYHEERGRFDAYLEDASGKVVWEVHYPEFVEDSESGELIETSTIFEDGYIKHIEDIDGLQKYLASISIIDEDDEITMSDIEPEVEEKNNLYEFVVPNWAMSALINGDYSGLSDEDEDKLNRFIEEVAAEYGNALFMLPSEEEIDLGFKYRNDIDDLGSDCSLLYIRRSEEMDESKDFAGGGETSKSRSMQMFGLTQEEYDYRDKIIAKMKSAKGDELKALEEEYAKSDVAKKINKGLSLKAMNKGGDTNGNIYYHVLEHGRYGEIGYHGYYETEEEANRAVKHLSDTFPHLHFEIFISGDTNEPPIVTMEKGGTLEERMKNVLTKEFELPIQMAIYVPSTQDVSKIISKREFQDRYEEVAKYVSNLFGGYSADPIDGGYVFNRDLIQEDVVKVVFYADRDSVEKSFKKVYAKIKDWCQEWGQDSMGFEVENDLYYVNSWTKDASNMLFPKSSDSKSDFNELSETDKKEAISKVKEEFRKMKFAGGGDIKDYDNYDDDDEEEEDEGEANLNEISSQTGIPVDVLKEYAEFIGVDYDRLRSRDINYYGRYDSEEDFMESLVDEGVISGSVLSGYLYMTNTDCRITAGEEADAYVENLDNSDLIMEADLEDKLDELNELVEKIEELENEIQEKTDLIDELEDKLVKLENEDEIERINEELQELKDELNELENDLLSDRKKYDNLEYKDIDDIISAAKDFVIDKQYEYVYDMLEKDPVDYFVHELGAYTEEELAKASFINIDYEKLARDFSSDYNIIEEDGDIYVFTSYKKGGAIGSASVLRTAKKYVNEVNRLIALAYDEDGDPLVVYDTSVTWESPSIYSPFKLSRGTLYGIEIDYPFGLGSKPTKKRIIVRKADLEFDGIGMLKDVAKMYRRALREAGIQYKLDSDIKYSDGGMTLEEQNKQMLLGKTKEYQHHSRELQEIIAKNPMIPAWVIAKATRASTDISDITHYLDSLPVNLKTGGKLWIQGAIKREGALRKKAKEMGLIKGEEKLSMSDLNRLEALGGVWSKRANLAKTLRRFSQEKSKKKFELGAELEFAKGGGVDRYNLSFNYNPSVFKNEDAEKLVGKYTNDWKRNNDWDEVSFFVQGLTKEKVENLRDELKIEDVYNIEYELGRYKYANGGRIKNQYESRTPASIWDYGWNKEQKRHFLNDHSRKIEKELGRQIEFFYADYKFKDLLPQVQKVITNHIYEGQYGKGGGIDDKFEISIYEERFGEYYDLQELPYSEGIKYLDKYRNNKNYKQSCEDGEFFSSIDGHHYVKFKKVKKDKSKYGHGGEVNFNWDKVSSVIYAQPIDYKIEIDGGRIPFFYLHREAEKLNGFDICNANYDAFYDSLSQGAFLCRIKYTDGQIKNGICFSKWDGSKMNGLVCLIDDVQGIKSALEELSFKTRPLVEEGQKEYLKSIGLYDLLKVDGEYAKGGGTKRKDLFETPEKMPKKIAKILEKYQDEEGVVGYEDMENMLKQFEAVGYTFDYGLDMTPYGLRPIGVKLNELEGFEEMSRGGGLDYKKPVFEVEFSWDKVTEDDFDSRKVYVNAQSVSDAENVVRGKFGKSYKNLKIIQIERVMAKGGNTNEYVAGYVDLSKVEPSFVNDSALDTLPVIDIVKKDVIKNVEKPIRSSHEIVQLIKKYYGDVVNTYEKLVAIMLNRANKPIYIYDHSKGSITGTVLDPQLILAAANKTLAKGIILIHNHPSGNLTPSTQDDDITKKISEASKYFDIVLLDHIIITNDGYFSYADEGRALYERGGISEIDYANGGKVEDLDNITDDLLATKIKIFLEKVKPYKNYWLDDKEDILYVYFDTESPIDQYEKAYKEATASMEFFDADGVEITHPKEGSTKMIIPLKKNVIFKYKDYSKDYLEE